MPYCVDHAWYESQLECPKCGLNRFKMAKQPWYSKSVKYVNILDLEENWWLQLHIARRKKGEKAVDECWERNNDFRLDR